jgi:hypothetical protein
MTESTPITPPPKKRQRRRSTVSVLRAAKAAGCASVEFSDGTVVKIIADEVPIDGANNDVDQWFKDNMNAS